MSEYNVLENGIYYAELDGTKGYYEIGRQNGRIFSDLIRQNVRVMRKIYGGTIGQEKLEEVLEKMLNSQYTADLKEHMPFLYDEMSGIADGSGISLKEAFMLNYLEEVPNAVLAESAGEAVPAGGKCTAAVVINRRDKSNLLFQNMDFTDVYEGFQVLYKINFSDKSLFVYGFVGQFGGIGVNSKGLGVTINVIVNISSNTGQGIPSTAITRVLLEQDSVKDCAGLMEHIPISTGGSYTVADPKTAVCFEASANKIVRIDPADHRYIIHTNHAVKTDDLIDVPGAFNGIEPICDEKGRSVFLTCERYALAERVVKSMYASLDVEEAVGILSTEPILLHLEEEFGLSTLQSVINQCSEEEPAIYVAKGREAGRKYVRLGF